MKMSAALSQFSIKIQDESRAGMSLNLLLSDGKKNEIELERKRNLLVK